MKDQLWLVFVAGAVLSWGAYVPVLHEGQTLLSKGSLRAFLCVGIAYFLTAVLVPIALLAAGLEPMQFNARGIAFGFAAGVLGAAGALCIILALKYGGTPAFVPPWRESCSACTFPFSPNFFPASNISTVSSNEK